MRVLVIVLTLLACATVAIAGDFDDGISNYTEDNVSKWDELGEKDRNVNFIKLKAKSQAAVRANSGGVVTGTTGDGNMNSVVLGAGGTVHGDIIIIDESRGDKTQVVE